MPFIDKSAKIIKMALLDHLGTFSVPRVFFENGVEFKSFSFVPHKLCSRRYVHIHNTSFRIYSVLLRPLA